MKFLCKTGLAVILGLSAITATDAKKHEFAGGKIEGVTTIQELDEAAVFSFAVMSDNKGDGPKAKPEFRNMVQWIADAGDAFVIGLGDHVVKGGENDFLPFLVQDAWWHTHFYPNVAGGENEFYGEGQGDLFAGAPLLKMVHLSYKPHVSVRDNGCEYYAQIEVSGYTVHLIQLHYSDIPRDYDFAFSEDSRAYLVSTLESIEKGPKDIIIVAAHSIDGFWLDELSGERQRLVAEKADLVLAATTRFFTRDWLPGCEHTGALCINTGSITYPVSYSPYGYVEVHVLEKPLTLVVQYINAALPERQMQHHEYSYIKVVDGPVIETSFREPRGEEDMDVVVFTLDQTYAQEDMYGLVRDIMLEYGDGDEAYVDLSAGLPSGEVTKRDLWQVFPHDDRIYVLTLTAEEAEQTFGERMPLKGRDEIRLVINSYQGEYLIRKLSLPEDRWEEAGFSEIEMLVMWFTDYD